MNDWIPGALGVLCLVCAVALGWIVSANTIAAECSNIGAFYVGKTVYECKVR